MRAGSPRYKLPSRCGVINWKGIAGATPAPRSYKTFTFVGATHCVALSARNKIGFLTLMGHVPITNDHSICGLEARATSSPRVAVSLTGKELRARRPHHVRTKPS